MLNRILLVTAFCVITAQAAFPANTPSWYPQACGSTDYCAPVEHVDFAVLVGGRAPRLIVSSIHGSAFILRPFPVRESGDRRVHVCMRYDPFGSLEVTCLIVPSSVF